MYRATDFGKKTTRYTARPNMGSKYFKLSAPSSLHPCQIKYRIEYERRKGGQYLGIPVGAMCCAAFDVLIVVACCSCRVPFYFWLRCKSFGMLSARGPSHSSQKFAWKYRQLSNMRSRPLMRPGIVRLVVYLPRYMLCSTRGTYV